MVKCVICHRNSLPVKADYLGFWKELQISDSGDYILTGLICPACYETIKYWRKHPNAKLTLILGCRCSTCGYTWSPKYRTKDNGFKMPQECPNPKCRSKKWHEPLIPRMTPEKEMIIIEKRKKWK